MVDQEESGELSSSKLGTLEYWESAYDRELENFVDNGDEGEIWFGKQTARRVLSYIKEKEINCDTTSIIDIGCGNGYTCCLLAQSGYKNILGVDYSEKAIHLARSIAENKNLNINYSVVDILSFEATGDEIKFDLALDKGTYDAIGLCPDDPKSKRYKYRHYLTHILKPSALFIITSCNWTTKELVEFFTENNEFELVEEIKSAVSFSFGGQTGSTTSTIVFRFKK